MDRKTWIFIVSASLLFLAPPATDAQWVGNNIPFSVDVFSIYVGGSDVFVGTDSAVYLSTDGGVSWVHPANIGMQGGEVVYAFAAKDSFVFAGTSSHGVFRSSDLGSSWHPVS